MVGESTALVSAAPICAIVAGRWPARRVPRPWLGDVQVQVRGVVQRADVNDAEVVEGVHADLDHQVLPHQHEELARALDVVQYLVAPKNRTVGDGEQYFVYRVLFGLSGGLRPFLETRHTHVETAPPTSRRHGDAPRSPLSRPGCP